MGSLQAPFSMQRGGEELIDISAFIGPVLSAAFGGLSAFVGAWFAFSTRLAKVEQKVDNLTASVNKHNGVIERTFKLEERMEGALHSIDEVKGEIRHYHHN